MYKSPAGPAGRTARQDRGHTVARAAALGPEENRMWRAEAQGLPSTWSRDGCEKKSIRVRFFRGGSGAFCSEYIFKIDTLLHFLRNAKFQVCTEKRGNGAQFPRREFSERETCQATGRSTWRFAVSEILGELAELPVRPGHRDHVNGPKGATKEVPYANDAMSAARQKHHARKWRLRPYRGVPVRSTAKPEPPASCREITSICAQCKNELGRFFHSFNNARKECGTPKNRVVKPHRGCAARRVFLVKSRGAFPTGAGRAIS